MYFIEVWLCFASPIRNLCQMKSYVLNSKQIKKKEEPVLTNEICLVLCGA